MFIVIEQSSLLKWTMYLLNNIELVGKLGHFKALDKNVDSYRTVKPSKMGYMFTQ